MALERQRTFVTTVNNTLDVEVEEFLQNNEIDPAAIQVVIDGGNGRKTATLTYANREELKDAYEKQGRAYSESDAVTYCHVKDIILPFSEDLDKVVNEFLMKDNVGVVSIARYFTAANQGVFVLYIDLKEQQKKIEQKKEEAKKAQEELAQKLASEAVKDVELETNDVINKYAETVDEKSNEQPKEKISEEKQQAPEEEQKAVEKKKKRFGKNK